MSPRLLALAVLLAAAPALAGESPFGYIYTTDTHPAGRWEYEQWSTLRAGKARGRYAALDVRSELETGVTDRLQASLYVNGSYLYRRDGYAPDAPAEDLPGRRAFDVNGASAELVYRVLSPYKDGLGLALYAEPEISARDPESGEDETERAIETKLLLQKDFLDDTIVAALNLIAEPEWEVDQGRRKKTLTAGWTLGVAARVARGWDAGLELRQDLEYAGMNTGHQTLSALFLGPSVHYAGEGAWWTLTVLPQVSGWPSRLGPDSTGRDLSGGGLNLAERERLEVRFRLGVPFGGPHG